YELEILKEEQYYEALFRSNPDCMAVLGLDRSIRQINPVFEKTFGYTQIESKGLLLDQLLSPVESFQPNTESIIADGEKQVARIWQCRKKDGSRIVFKYDELPVLLNGINHGWVATFNGCTPAVSSIQVPDLLSKQKDDLVEDLTGRLRSPLNSMLELIAMLEDLHLAPEQSQRLDAAKENASSLLELLIEVRNRKRRETVNHKVTAPTKINQSQYRTGSPGIVTKISQKADRNALRILLVEDNPINQKLAMRLLQKGGHFVRMADNGIAALRILSQQAFDIVLMDLQMPEMDGLEATRQIRLKEPEGRHQVIIAMTAEGPGGEREKCFRAGMDAFIAKPLDIDALFTLLDKYTAEKKVGKILPGAEILALEPETELVNIEDALPRFGGEIAVYFEFLARFIKQLKQTDQKLRAAYKKGDVEQLHSLSHGLKGTAANFEAITVRDSASALEELTANNTVVGAYTLIND
ncbi:response regulator, partial [bacterium]|nr:response regulator [bacterium]